MTIRTVLPTLLAIALALVAATVTMSGAQAGPTARMAHVERGPVPAKFLRAALTGKKTGRIRSAAPWECIPPALKAVLGEVAQKFGPVTVNSSHRSKARNKRVGGKSRSFHLKCQAVDFKVHSRKRGLSKFLRNHKLVGGWKRYARTGHYHIDTGPKRTW